MTLQTVPAITMLPRRRFTVAEYERMGAAGIFGPHERVELIEGEIVQMNPIGSAHASCVVRLTQWLGQHLDQRGLVSVQNPLVLPTGSVPQPDLMVLRPHADGYANAHPTPGDVLLLIEVADTTLAYDRGVKFGLYATVAVPEVWLVDLVGSQVERHSEPRDGIYRHVAIARRGESLASVELPRLTLPADMILGPPRATVE